MLCQKVVQSGRGSKLASCRCPNISLRCRPRSLGLTATSTVCMRSIQSASIPPSQSATRRSWLFAGLSFIGASMLLYDRTPLRLEAPQPPEDGQEAFRIESSTSQSFPVILPTPLTPLPSRKLTLVGLGVRTVSFLRVKVYAAGLYIDLNALQSLNKVQGWTGFQQAWMTDSKESHSGEELLASLLDQRVAFAIRIVPVRPTDYGHLRDGFTRAIQGRAKLARKQGQLTESSDEALSHSLQDLKDAFPRASLPKGQALDLIFAPSPSGSGYDLALEEGGKVLGRVDSPQGAIESRFSVARQLFLAYFADQNEISKPFKESVAQGFEQAVR